MRLQQLPASPIVPTNRTAMRIGIYRIKPTRHRRTVVALVISEITDRIMRIMGEDLGKHGRTQRGVWWRSRQHREISLVNLLRISARIDPDLKGQSFSWSIDDHIYGCCCCYLCRFDCDSFPPAACHTVRCSFSVNLLTRPDPMVMARAAGLMRLGFPES